LVLGGDTRLRGYPPQAFIGKDAVAQTVEYRTRGFQVLSVQIGGALFYDSGDAFDGWSDLKLKQAVGFGFRAVFPQAERIAFRADWGFPVEQGTLRTPGSLFVTFGQAFGMPTPPQPTLATDYHE
jgi:hemolysin activation/secretion protein